MNNNINKKKCIGLLLYVVGLIFLDGVFASLTKEEQDAFKGLYIMGTHRKSDFIRLVNLSFTDNGLFSIPGSGHSFTTQKQRSCHGEGAYQLHQHEEDPQSLVINHDGSLSYYWSSGEIQAIFFKVNHNEPCNAEAELRRRIDERRNSEEFENAKTGVEYLRTHVHTILKGSAYSVESLPLNYKDGVSRPNPDKTTSSFLQVGSIFVVCTASMLVVYFGLKSLREACNLAEDEEEEVEAGHDYIDDPSQVV
jgi:hypothetical protein